MEEYVGDHIKVNFLSKVFIIITVVLSICIPMVCGVGIGQILLVVFITTLIGLAGTEGDKLLMSGSTLLILWAVFGVINNGIVSGLLLTILYFTTYTATRCCVCTHLDTEIIKEYEHQQSRQKSYNRRRRKRRRRNNYPTKKFHV